MNLKVGFIGLGRMGITHLSILNTNPNTTVTSACDPSKILDSLFRKYFSGINLYNNYKELLEKEKPDAVVISTPPVLHFNVVKDCIEKGIHVFVEKPFTVSYNESSSLSQMAERAGIINQVGYVNRFNDIFLKTKQMIDDGIIGKVIHYKSEMFTATTLNDSNGKGWRENPESGGGCLNEVASHAIDLVNFLIGIPDGVCGSVLNRVYSKHVDDIVTSTFLYKNGMAGSLYVNWSDSTFKKASNRIELFGKQGKILVDQHDLKVFLKSGNEKYNLKPGWNKVFITEIFKNVPFYLRGNEFTSQLYHFVDCINDRNLKKRCTFADAAQTHRVINLMREDYINNYGSKYGTD